MSTDEKVLTKREKDQIMNQLANEIIEVRKSAESKGESVSDDVLFNMLDKINDTMIMLMGGPDAFTAEEIRFINNSLKLMKIGSRDDEIKEVGDRLINESDKEKKREIARELWDLLDKKE